MKKIRNYTYHIIRSSEKYLKVDMIYITKGSFFLTLMQITTSASAFFLSIIFANFISKDTYGSYKYILSVFSLLSVTTLSGMNVSLTRAYSAGEKGLLLPSLKEKIKYGLIGSFLAIILSIYYYLQGNQEVASALILSAIFLPLLDSFNIYETIYYGKKDFKTPNIYSIFNQGIAFVCMALVAINFPSNLLMILSAYFIPWTIGRGLMTKKSQQIDSGLADESTIKSVIDYGKHLTVLNSINTFANFLDRILIYNTIGAVPLAIYSIAIAPIEQVKSLLSRTITALSLPKYSERNKSLVKQHSLKWSFRVIWFAIPIIILYIILSPFLFAQIFPKYLDSIPYTNIYALTLLGLPIYLMQTALNSIGAKKVLYTSTTISSMIQIILIPIGAYSFGLGGILTALVISKILQLGVYGVAIKIA